MERIIGIDIGLRNTGYGIIDFDQNSEKIVEGGVIKTDSKENLHERLLTIFNDLDSIYKKYKPKAILINDLGTIETSNFIMREAKNNNTKIISLILSWDNLVSKGIGSLKPDYVIAWNNIMVQELEQYHGIKREKIYVGGIPHWDTYSNDKIMPGYDIDKALGFNKPYKKLIYFATW